MGKYTSAHRIIFCLKNKWLFGAHALENSLESIAILSDLALIVVEGLV